MKYKPLSPFFFFLKKKKKKKGTSILESDLFTEYIKNGRMQKLLLKFIYRFHCDLVNFKKKTSKFTELYIDKNSKSI